MTCEVTCVWTGIGRFLRVGDGPRPLVTKCESRLSKSVLSLRYSYFLRINPVVVQ